mgnify:CR=1 FL=1
MRAHRAEGFTLLELMVALTIASILIAMAVPNFRTMVIKNSVEGQIDRLSAAIANAKAEALSRGKSVVICGSANGTSCSGASDWSTGWIVFVDDGNGGGTAADETRHADEILIAYQNVEGNNELEARDTGGAITALSFSGESYLNSGRATTLKVCEPDKDTDYARALVLLGSGQVAYSRDGSGDSDSVHEDVAGSNLVCS